MAHQIETGRLAEVEDAGASTLAFYEREAETYFRSTLKNDLSDLYRLFLCSIPEGGLILDAGSGSGRDTLAFLDAGYRVEAFDASRRLSALAERMTGVAVEVARFENWGVQTNRYDGIWCFASLLHVAERDLFGVLDRLTSSLRPGAPFFASFKRGEGPIVDDRGRRFTNLTRQKARTLFERVDDLERVNVWEMAGPTAMGDPTVWIYVLARRRT